jgi:hypothetical protein
MARYGLCETEWTDNGYWPRQLYVREGRRMVGAYVVRQSDLDARRLPASTVAIGSYRIDAHNVSRWVSANGVYVEGSIYEPYRDYGIPYEAMVPHRAEATNLLVTVCLSSSHVAWAGLRVEPHLMMLGEAGGQAAAMAAKASVSVQDVNVGTLQAALQAHGVILTLPP